jgi:hypothetical protein
MRIKEKSKRVFIEDDLVKPQTPSENNSIIEITLLTIGIMIVLVILEPIIGSGGVFFELFTLIIIGISGIGVGVILVGLYVRAIKQMKNRLKEEKNVRRTN